MEGDFVYKFFMMDITGKAYVNMSDMSFDLEVNLTTQDGERPGQSAPAVKLLNIDINVDPDNVDVRLEGGMVARIAELFTELFKKEILTLVIANTEKEIETIINVDVNADLRKFGSEVFIPELDYLKFDYSVVLDPVVQ
jgi:hypothetical protein